MTQGKLKMYRKDRLFTSDKDRLQNLMDSLKNVRITDESAFFNSMPEGPSSPTKAGKGRGGGGGGGDGMPPKGPGKGGGGDKGGASGPSGSSGYGTYSSGGKALGGSAADKGSSNQKGTSDYSSAARNPRNKQMASGGK